MKGLITVSDLFQVNLMKEKCWQGFGPAHCTKVMCDNGNQLTNCCFVQEWISCRKQESLFGLFWINCVEAIRSKTE